MPVKATNQKSVVPEDMLHLPVGVTYTNYPRMASGVAFPRHDRVGMREDTTRSTDTLSPEALAMLKAGLEASARDEVVDLGSFCDSK